MKLVKETKKEIFKAFPLTLIIETEHEAEAFAQMFNYIPITDFLNIKGIGDNTIGEIRQYMMDKGKVKSNIDEIDNMVKNSMKRI